MSSPSARAFALCAALCALVSFRPAIDNGFAWDDHRLIESNRELTTFGAWKTAFTTDFWHGVDTQAHLTGGDHRLYRPLLKLVLIGEVALFGTGDPFGFHLVSLFLHAANVLLVFAWLMRRFGKPWAAMLGAMVFAIHPARAESVAWVSGMSDLWATLVVLIALTAWDRKRPVLAGWVLLVAMLFKESVLAVPIALAADALWIGAGETRRRDVFRAACIFWAMITAFALRLHIVPLKDGGSLVNVGSRTQRFLATVGQFASMAVWPFHPTTQRGYIPSSAVGGTPTYPASAVAMGIAVIVALAVLSVIGIKRADWRPALADLSWFWILALPTLNIVPLAGIQYTAERFLYLPSLGLAALAARGAVALAGSARPIRIAGSIAAAATLFLYGAVSFAHSRDFASEVALWGSEHRKYPSNALVLEGLITAASKSGQYELSAQSAREAVALEPVARGKAYMLIQWLRAEIDLNRDSQDRLGHYRVEAEHFAVGRPTGELATVAAGIAPDGIEWASKSPMLTLTRAWLALRTLDFEAAATLAHQAESDKFTHDAAVRVFLLAAIGSGHWDMVDEMAQSADSPPSVANILRNRAADGHSNAYVSASLFQALNEPAIARALAEADLAMGKDGDAIPFLLAFHIERREYDLARKLVGDHRTPANEEWAKQALAAIDQAEQLERR